MMKQRQKTKLYASSYKRLDKEKESGSESGEETELFVRSKPQRKEIPTIEKVVEEGDTLQSLAIRYHCTIADLKRLNNIHKENEIFAKRTIRVPQRPFSMALASVHLSGRSSPDSSNQPSTSNLIDMDSLHYKLTNGKLDVLNGTTNEVNEIIFNSQIIQKPCERVTETFVEDTCEEETHLLSEHDRELPRPDTFQITTLSCSGADGDISWITLIVFIVILIFAVPLILVYMNVAGHEHHGS